MSKDIVLYVNNVGSIEFPRLVIQNQEGEYWSGEEWTHEENDARLYLDDAEVSIDCHKIQLDFYSDKPCVLRYMVPVFIEVHSDKEIPIRKLKEWFLKASRFTINMTDHGAGPEGSLALAKIDWPGIVKDNESEVEKWVV